jgi:hypothetical protein
MLLCMGALGCRLALAGVLLGGVLHAEKARADAVPPAPWCLPGEVSYSSHQGGGCRVAAPKNCDPGYRGQLGGICVLEACTSDSNCQAGEACLYVDACSEERDLIWNGNGWAATSPGYSRSPLQPAPGPPPKAWVRLNICGQDGACAAPRECRATQLCYPTSAVGHTKAKVAKTRAVPEVLPDGVTESELFPDWKDPALTSPRSKEVSPTCRRGCAVASSSSVASCLALPALAAAALWRRRRASAAGAVRRSRTGCLQRP